MTKTTPKTAEAATTRLVTVHPGPDVIDPISWMEWFAAWRDIIRAPVVVIVLAMIFVLAGSVWSALGTEPDSVHTWANGVAAVVTAVAALAEARHSRVAWIDHEVRIRIIEESAQ